jgi:formylglycine-generating enzyme required for sulfatase activity/serine/threonine protein kinase
MLYEYQIEKKLGEGGFGITYLAIDTHLDMRVAIKEYLPSDFAMRQSDVTIAPKSPALKEGFDWGLNAFIDEAKTIAQFDALNIVKIHRFFKGNGTAYIVMEYCDAGSLNERIKAQTYSEQATQALLKDLVKGLQVVHGNHIFHRDIKPDNIMYRSNGTPVLIDFGAARQTVEGQTRTVTSMVTPGFAPPEQYSQNSKFGPWTDIYALAAVAYTCLKGRKPSDAVQRMVDDDYQPLGQDPQASGFLRAIDWGLQLAANQRPQDLASWLSSWDSGIVPDSGSSDHTVILPSGSEATLQMPTDSHASAPKVENNTTPESGGGRVKFAFIFILALIILGGGYYGYNHLQQDKVELKTSPISDVKVLEPPTETQIQSQQVSKPKIDPVPEEPEPVTTGLLWITTEPSNAQVQILDIDTQYSAGMTLKLGRYGINVKSEGYQDKIEFIDIGKGDNNFTIKLAPLKVKEPLTPAPVTVPALGQLQITTQPSNARIILLDVESRYSSGMKLKLGRYRIKISAPGYEDKIETINVNSGDNNVAISLVRKVLDIPLPTMVTIAGGRFQMGSDKGENYEKPVHSVSVKTFKMSKSEITFAQWDACTDAGGCNYRPHDEGWGRGNRPVINVSYKDITEEFIPWLNQTTGDSYRLPTEAEWEYAARSGRTSRYSWGYTINCSQARYGYLSGECKKRQNTDRVNSFIANSFGLHDMHGNVWEWTQDCWNDSYSAAPNNGEAWSKGDCSQRVLRGGSWLSRPDALRSAYRFRNSTSVRNNDLGFRLAQ